MAAPYIGELRIFAGQRAPDGWAFCDGCKLNISEHPALYELLGTAYGGDGRTTFALPDLRGRAAISMGEAPGLSPRRRGEIGGTETVRLTEGNLPAHTHAVKASRANANQRRPDFGSVLAAAVDAASPQIDGRYLPSEAPTAGGAQPLSPEQITPAAGGSEPIDNVMPSFALTYIIALSGMFPSSN